MKRVKATELARWIGLLGAPAAAALAYVALGGPTEAGSPPDASDLPESGRRVIALAVLMAGWWLTEAIPLAATSLLPLVVLPALNVTPMRSAAAAYADELIFLFLGGFLLGRGFERSGLHRRVALLTLRAVGVRPAAVIAGVMLATGLISMWVSNTATAMMMLPIGMGLITLVEDSIKAHAGEAREWDRKQVSRFSMAMLLGIAYAASIGGIGTPIGTPPNMTFVATVQQLFGDEVTFAWWFKIGAPMVVLLLPAAWALLVLGLYRMKAKRIPGGKGFVREQLKSLGPIRSQEVVTLVVFLLAVTFWIGRERISPALGWVFHDAQGKAWLPLTDAGIAIIAALLLFVIPVRSRRVGAPELALGVPSEERDERRAVLTARDVDAVPWSILLLFGGGLSLAAAMRASGVDTYLGRQFEGLQGLPTPVLILVIVASITLLSELASNTAVAATTLPILAAAAKGLGVHPYVLMMPATLGASCGFMLPVATPPNAIVFGTGRLTVWEMAKAGLLMDVISIVTIAGFLWLFGASLMGI